MLGSVALTHGPVENAVFHGIVDHAVVSVIAHMGYGNIHAVGNHGLYGQLVHAYAVTLHKGKACPGLGQKVAFRLLNVLYILQLHPKAIRHTTQ